MKKLSPQTLVDDIYQLAKVLDQNPFWKAQIQQAHVDENFEFQLVPRIGNHIIELGKVHLVESKLAKLKIFYKEGLMHTGWNQYKSINLKFKNQIVCTKK